MAAQAGAGVQEGVPESPSPVGGRLGLFAERWKRITADKFVRATVAEGYRLEFTGKYTLRSTPLFFPAPRLQEQRIALREETENLIAKKAVVRLSEQEWRTPGFYSHVFMRPKPSGAWRPILNLKLLNKAIRARKFRMDTLQVVVDSLEKGEYVTSIDLKDAYFHVAVRPADRKFLRFTVEGEVFEFQVLPFGLSTAPRVFSRVVKALVAFLRKRGLKMFAYLDDWLIANKNFRCLVEQTSLAIRETEEAGFVLRMDKCDLTPTLSPVYLGAFLDMRRGFLRPSDPRIEQLESFVIELLSEGSAPALFWLQMLGRMASFKGLVPFSMLHMRLLQLCFQSQWNRSLPVSTEVTFPVTLIPHLRWWLDRDNTCAGVPFHPPPIQVVLTTDASDFGWGGHIDDHQTSGQWNAEEQVEHINMLELRAVMYSLQSFVEMVRHKSVLVQTDNTTVAAYINKQGGDQVAFPVFVNIGSLQVVLPAWGHAESALSPGRAERSGGRSVQGTGESDRVGSEPEGRGNGVQDLLETAHRPVCDSVELRSSDVLRQASAPHGVGDGCVEPGLVRDAGICLPPNLPDSSGFGESGGGAVSPAPDSSVVASSTLVSSPAVVGGGPTEDSSDEGGPPDTGEDVVPAARESTLDCVAADKCALRKAGLSERAAEVAAASRRPSTTRVYSSRLRHWQKWCRVRGQNPDSAAVTVVADFLAHLHDSGLQTNTVAGYRSAIGSIHQGFPDGSSVSDNPLIHRVIKGLFHLRPPPQRLVPSWSLTAVLRALARAPFEPLAKAPLKWVTYKCAFLLSLASARRSSQIAALSIEPDFLVWTHNGVKLSTKLGFLAKNQRVNFTPEPISLQSIKAYSDTAEDKLWCPVRALKYYVERTKSLRGGCKQLFVKTVAPHDGVTSSTLAGWIVDTIKAAYPVGQAPGLDPKAHDVRGVSASWAKFNSASLDEIISAAAWKTPTTFTSSYVKDVVRPESQFRFRVISAGAKATKTTS